jgi:hypothetical protein
MRRGAWGVGQGAWGEFVLLVSFALPASNALAAFDVTTLFAQLAKNRPEAATFQEKKYLALLDKPLESSGTLSFTPPDKLEKRTTSPKPERVVVERDRVTLERGGKSYSMGLAENPGIAVLVESIRGTLAGDLASVTRTYSVGLEGDERAWRLKMRPLDPSLGTLVERVEIVGAQWRVRSVEIYQADGDRSVMSLAPAAR